MAYNYNYSTKATKNAAASSAATQDNSMSGIYMIRCNRTKSVYIGESGQILNRWVSHVNELNHGNHHNKNLQADWNEYGVEAFEFVVLHKYYDESKPISYNRAYRMILEGLYEKYFATKYKLYNIAKSLNDYLKDDYDWVSNQGKKMERAAFNAIKMSIVDIWMNNYSSYSVTDEKVIMYEVESAASYLMRNGYAPRGLDEDYCNSVLNDFFAAVPCAAVFRREIGYVSDDIKHNLVRYNVKNKLMFKDWLVEHEDEVRALFAATGGDVISESAAIQELSLDLELNV